MPDEATESALIDLVREAGKRSCRSRCDVTSLRCACHEYRLVAQGRTDFVIGAKVKVWDHAAGALAVAEAGGASRLLGGGDYAPTDLGVRLVAASRPEVADAVAGSLSAALAKT